MFTNPAGDLRAAVPLRVRRRHAGAAEYSSYVDYLMPGMFVQTVVFGAMNTAIGLAADLKTGLIERFRSLPMARSAVLAGRTTADMVRNVFVVLLMAVVGFAVGFRVQTNSSPSSPGSAARAVRLRLSWIFATVGLAVGDPETAQAAAFPILAPLVFASSAFVPLEYHAGLAPGLRRVPAGVGRRRRRPRSDARRTDGPAHHPLAPLDRGDHCDLRPPRRVALPQDRLTVSANLPAARITREELDPPATRGARSRRDRPSSPPRRAR